MDHDWNTRMNDTAPDSASVQTPRDAVYRIGAVARLTGITPNTLRIWERRYRIVEPGRTPKGGRLYSSDDITRLALIKVLVDRGDAISSVANLSLAELKVRLAQRQRVAETQASGLEPRSVCVVGPALAMQVRQAPTPPEHITLVGIFDSLRDFQHAPPACELLVVEVPALDPPQLELLKRVFEGSRAAALLVLYAFANQPTLEAARQLGFTLARAPLRPAELWDLTATLRAPEAPGRAAEASQAIPARRFNDSQLARFAAASVRITCECPHHLADMIRTLVAFEDYSQRCEHRNAEDAELHAYLHASTARARAILEQALARVAEVEGIDY